MKLAMGSRDVKRIILSAIPVIIGLLIIGSVELSWKVNPPPDADIGGGLLSLFGLVITWIGGICLLATLLYPLFRKITHKPQLAKLLSFIVIVIVVVLVWYIDLGVPAANKQSFQKELESRYSSFEAYREPVKLNATPSQQSTAVTTTGKAASPSSVTLDLHACTVGNAIIHYATGTTYFALSGVKQDPTSTGISDCIFYIGQEVSGQTWDGTLYAKCTWFISNDLQHQDYNKPTLQVTDAGLQYNDLLGHCQDLRTGVAPDLGP
jgi:hypothetical protein